MKNLNEETQILSHDEEAHLNSNDSSNNIEDNSNQAKNISNNLNSEEIKQNNNISTSNSNNNQNGAGTELKQKNFDDQKRYHINSQSYNPHHRHSHNHDFTNPKFLFFLAVGFIKMTNNQIMQLFSGFTTTLDRMIYASKIPSMCKRILHTKQILLLVYMINVQYLLYSVQSIFFLNFLNKHSLRLFIISIVGLHVHYYFYSDRLFVEKDEEMEKFVLKRNPQMKRGRCEGCNNLRICRSSHCFYCKKCVKKFQLHSDWYNICIGTNNELLYGITLFFTNGYIFVSDIILWYYILVRTDLLNYLVLTFSLFALVSLFILFNSLKFLYSFFFDCLFVNLTMYEKYNTRMLTYLWDERRVKIFNPFNKGFQRNLEEMVINTFDFDIYSEYKNFANHNLSEIIDDDKINNEVDNRRYFDDFSSYKTMISLVEHFDPFITSKKNIYKFVDGKEIINWNRLMIFTAFDITNSPFKDVMVKQAKMMIQQREMYLQNMKKKENEKENAEKIDISESNENIEVIDNNNNGNKEEQEKIDNKVEETHVIKENDDNGNNENEKIDENDKNENKEESKDNDENDKL